jgi:hypothetical protein
MRNMFEKYGGVDVLQPAPEHTVPNAVFWQEQTPVAADSDSAHSCQDAVRQAVGADAAIESGGDTDTSDSGDEGEAGAASEDDYLHMQSTWAAAGWLSVNPLGTPTERELYVEQQGLPVYRLLLQRC